MSKIFELDVALKELITLKNEAKAEFDGLSLRDKVEVLQTVDTSFLRHEPDGGFLYASFPGGGWGHVLSKEFYYERNQTVDTAELIQQLFEAWYSEEKTAEESEELALSALESSDEPGCKLLRAVLEAGVSSFEFDW